jgi:hypothetical protein
MELLRVLVWPITVLLLAVLGWRFNQMSQTKRLRLAILIDEAKSHAAEARKVATDAMDASVRIAEGHSEVTGHTRRLAALLGDLEGRLSKRLEAVEAVARAAGEARQPPARRV